MNRIVLLTINEGLAISGVMPTAQPGVEYFARLTGHGGIVPYQWFLDAGTLPAGLALTTDSDGAAIISGTTSAIGQHDITIMMRDAEGRSVRRTYRLIVQAEPLVISGDAPAGQVGVPYSYAYAVGGGLPTYTFSISSGALPAGLSLNPSTGEISGTPTTGESTSFRVRVTDSQSPPATADLDDSISVAYAALAVAGSWTGVDVGNPLGGSPRAITGGLAPYSVSLLSGTRPAGVTISVSGSTLVAAGNTTTVASYAWTDRVTSADGQHVDVSGSVSIAPIAYPEIANTYTYASSGIFGSSHVISTPGAKAGDLLVVISGSPRTTSAPAGWTAHGSTNAGTIGAAIFSRVLPADTSSVTLTTSSGGQLVAHALRVAAGDFHASTAIAQARQANTSDVTDHPVPSLSPSWGAERTLWIACAVQERSSSPVGVSSYPLPDDHVFTDYTSFTGSIAVIATCSAGSTVATLAPSDYVSTTAHKSITALIAVRPA